MRIIRDGKEFELTFSELIEAHKEFEFDCMVQDVKHMYEDGEYDVTLSEDDILMIADDALRGLSKNDGYYEAYWSSVECALKYYIDNLPV